MLHLPDDLRQRLLKYDQGHVLAWWEKLSEVERRELLNQLQSLDLELLWNLYEQRDASQKLPAFDRVEPIPVTRLDAEDRIARRVGEDALRKGDVAALVVAGGQGSRLGFEYPKGMYPIGPVSQKSLFQLHAEKLLALSRRYGKPIPFLVMTSPGNHVQIETFFAEHNHFGLPKTEVHFFSQGTMPALDWSTGRLLLESPGRLFVSPNGHGGVLISLADSGLLDRLRGRGVRHLFYFQVDNPLVKVADPVFLGHHCVAQAESSTKVVAKKGPEDKLGNLVLMDGRCSVIEYSDLPPGLGRQIDEQGRLRFWAGNTAIHIFDVDFLARVCRGADRLPFHLARKKVPYLNSEGVLVQPAEENALKFEMFIFDVLPRTKRWTVVETSRAAEFEPLKNATGPDSPPTIHQAISNQAADWLEKAGVEVPRRADGNAAVLLEISPLFALDAEELAAKVDRSLQIQGSLYLE